MIDGINCRVHGKSLQNIMHCDKLQFIEYPNRSEAKYKGLIITVYSEPLQAILRGSIHKFKNEGRHNADCFTYQDFRLALTKLKEELGICSSELEVRRFEIGVNVSLNYPEWQCINTIALINNRMPTKKSNRLSVEYQQYSIKVYSKSKQYSEFRGKNIIRIEIAYSRKDKLTKDLCKISTLDEVLEVSVWRKMADVLKRLVCKIVFFDYSEIKKERLEVKEALIFYEWSNPVRILQEPDKSRKCRMKKRAYDIYLKYSENSKAKDLLRRVDNTLKEILKFETTVATN